jgi:hypothetical protein
VSESLYEEFEDVIIEQETAKALLLTINGTKRWVPKSQIGKHTEISVQGEIGTVYIQPWFAEKEGL